LIWPFAPNFQRGRVAFAGDSHAQVTVLAATGPDAENSFEQPNQVAPQTQTLRVNGAKFAHQFPPWLLTILRVKTN
jgi:alpha-L-arabinofuranosidase